MSSPGKKALKALKVSFSCAGLPILDVVVQSGDKRDDISASAVRIGERPICHPASVSSGLVWPQAGVR
jgi:hypothetical protein